MSRTILQMGARFSPRTHTHDGLTGPDRVPAGGTAGQVLEKVDGEDFNTQWSTPSGGGGGLTHPQILARGLGA